MTISSQVSRVVKSISSVLRFRSACVTSTSNIEEELRKINEGCSVVVATPGRLLSLLKNRQLLLNDTQTIILDEADVLFLDETFPLQGIGEFCPENAQFLFVTATLPDVTLKQITREFPNTTVFKGPGLHRIPPTVEEKLIDCSLKISNTKMSQKLYAESVLENKKEAMVSAMLPTSGLSKEIERTLIFCNTIDHCRQVENALLRADRNGKVRKILSYHSAIDTKVRLANLEEFTRKLLALPVVLICTDRASRGIDFNSFNVSSSIFSYFM